MTDGNPESDPLVRRRLPGRRWIWGLVAVAPILLVWWLKTQAEPRPFWVHYYDPEAIYFFEGLDLTRLRAPGSFDRPGAQVQLLSALIAGMRHSTALDFDGFRQSAYLVTLALLVGGLVVLFRTVLSGLSGPVALAGSWTFYACPQAFEYLAVWSPEALYLPVGAVALALLCRVESHGVRARPLFAAGLGVGTLCALKLVFLPWVAGLAVASLLVGEPGLAKRFSRATVAGAGVALAFAAWTAHMLPRFGEMLDWVGRLLWRSGEYGNGSPGLPAPSLALANVRELLLAAKGWYLLLALLAAFVALRLFREHRTDRLGAGTRWLAVFAGTSLVAGLAFAVRQPVPRYYLATGLLAILLVRLGARNAGRAGFDRLAGALLLAAVALLLAKQALLDLETHRRRIVAETELRERLETAVARETGAGGNEVVVWGFRAPIPSLALHVMARSAEDHAEIFGAYPTGGFVDWSGELRLPPPATRWRWLVLQGNEAPDAEAICDRALEVDRFVLFRWEECGQRLRRLPVASRRGILSDAGAGS